MIALTATAQILSTVLAIGGVILGLERLIGLVLNPLAARRQTRQVAKALRNLKPHMDDAHARMMAADHADDCFLRTHEVGTSITWCTGCADGTKRTATVIYWAAEKPAASLV